MRAERWWGGSSTRTTRAGPASCRARCSGGSRGPARPAISGLRDTTSPQKDVSIVHHADRRTDVHMPYAPGIVVRRGQLVFLSGVTAAPVYHSHPHREEEFDLPATMREQ